MELLTFEATGKIDGRKLSGVAHTYGSVTVDGRKHSFEAGALGASIKGDVVSFAYHDLTKPLASLKAGTLRLSDDRSRFAYEIDLPETSYVADLRAYVEAGNQLWMSFRYQPTARPRRVNGVTYWAAGQLASVDPVAMPAFEGTSVILNSAAEAEPAYSATIKLRARRLSEDVLRSRSTDAAEPLRRSR